jgi:hypothetical protein
MHDTSTRYWRGTMEINFLYSPRRLFILSIALCLSLLLVSCGGGGGGGNDNNGKDGGSGEGSNQTLAAYDFVLSLPADNPLEIGSKLGSETVTARLEPLAGPISGSYNMNTESISLNGGPILKISTDIWAGNEGILSINVNAPIVSSGPDNPVQAELGIAAGVSPNITFITLSASADKVTISQAGGSVNLTWDEFENILSTNAPTWQQQASLAYFIVNFILSQAEFSINTISLIEKNDAALQKNKSMITQGDDFAGSPPQGHAALGNTLMEWIDRTGGELGPGDSFNLTFSDFWSNDTTDTISTIYDGTARFVGFLENMDESRDIITSIGFVPNPGEPGGVYFDEGFTIYEVEENPSGIFTIDDTATITVKGGYSIMFVESKP